MVVKNYRVKWYGGCRLFVVLSKDFYVLRIFLNNRWEKLVDLK